MIKVFNYVTGTDAVRADLAAQLAAARLAPHIGTAIVELSPILHDGPFGLCECREHDGANTVAWTTWENVAESTDHDVYASDTCLPKYAAQAVEEANGCLWNRDDTISIEIAVARVAVARAEASQAVAA